MVLKAARRYASAFLQIALEKNMLETILQDVRFIHRTVDSSRELVLFLRSPIIHSDEKREALQSIFADSVEPVTLQFLEFITRKGREKLLGQIMKAFIGLYKEHSGIIDIEVRSAADLGSDQKERLHRVLEEATQKKVDLSYSTDSGLIGGLAVRIDDTVIDGTIKHKIDQLGALFHEAAI